MTGGVIEQRVEALRKELHEYFVENGLWYNARWYTTEEWEARGEPYGNEAHLSLTFEGPIYTAINYGESGLDVYGFIQGTAKKFGLFMEQGYAWSGHFYEA